MSKTIKVIDLLNKIANGEEVPNKIKWDDYIFEYDKNDKMYLNCYFNTICEYAFLDDEVEIIKEQQEHRIPEKLKVSDYKEVQSQFDLDVISRINEIINCLEKLK